MLPESETWMESEVVDYVKRLNEAHVLCLLFDSFKLSENEQRLFRKSTFFDRLFSGQKKQATALHLVFSERVYTAQQIRDTEELKTRMNKIFIEAFDKNFQAGKPIKNSPLIEVLSRDSSQHMPLLLKLCQGNREFRFRDIEQSYKGCQTEIEELKEDYDGLSNGEKKFPPENLQKDVKQELKKLEKKALKELEIVLEKCIPRPFQEVIFNYCQPMKD